MYPIVLNKEQSHAFIECACLKEFTNRNKVEFELLSSSNWESMVHIISYFIAMVLERKKKDGQNVRDIIYDLHALPETMFLDILTLDSEFIDFMLRHVNPEVDTMESAIVELYKRWIEHDYKTTLRM